MNTDVIFTKQLGINFEQRYRSKRWFELDFSLK